MKITVVAIVLMTYPLNPTVGGMSPHSSASFISSSKSENTNASPDRKVSAASPWNSTTIHQATRSRRCSASPTMSSSAATNRLGDVGTAISENASSTHIGQLNPCRRIDSADQTAPQVTTSPAILGSRLVVPKPPRLLCVMWDTLGGVAIIRVHLRRAWG